MKTLCKNKIGRTFIALVLSLVLVCNCNTFRKDTHAEVVTLTVTTAAGVVIVVTAAALVAIGGYLAVTGIYNNTKDELDNFVDKWLTYDADTYGIDHTTNVLTSAGLSVGETADGGIIIDMPENKQGQFVYVPGDSLQRFKDWATNKWDNIPPGDSGGGSDGGGDGGGNTPLWKRIMAGFMVSSFSVSTIVNSFYDFLHNSYDVEYVPSTPVAQVGNLEELNEYFKNLLLNEAFFSDVRFLKEDFMTNPPTFIKSNIECFDIYMSVYDPKFKDNLDFSTSTDVQRKYIVALAKCEDGSYYIFTCSITDYANKGLSYSQIDRTSKTGATRSNAYSNYVNNVMDSNENWTVKAAFKGEGSNFGDGFLTHYAVSNVSDPEPLPDDGSGQIKVGDTIYNIAQGDNIYNNPNYVTQILDGKTNANDKVIVTVPQPNNVTNVYNYPQTTDGNPITLVNPDDVDIQLDTDISQEDYDNENVFKMLYNFIQNFWTKCIQVLTQTLSKLFIPDLSNFKATYELFNSKFPIVDQVNVLLNKLIDYDFNSNSPPAFLIKYKSTVLKFESNYMPMIDFSIFESFRTLLHGIILFVSYFIFGKKVVGKITKVFQP